MDLPQPLLAKEGSEVASPLKKGGLRGVMMVQPLAANSYLITSLPG